jgi:hypothetical protein
MEIYGFENPMQCKEVFNKAQKSSCKIQTYKNTDLTYQGSYEKTFLELMEEKGFLNLISNGKHYEYKLKNKKHIYYSDYLFVETTIEIKSSWTYNKNGKDKDLELENETKWQSVRNFGDKIIILKSKKEIKNFLENIIY